MTPSQHTPKLADIEKYLAEADRTGRSPFPCLVLRSCTMEPMAPYLRYFALQEGLDLSLDFGGGGTAIQEALGDGIAARQQPLAAIIVLLRLVDLAPALVERFPQASAEEIDEECRRLRELVTALLAGIRRQSDALVLWHSFEPPRHAAYGVADAGMPRGQTATIARLNGFLKETLGKKSAMYYVDMEGPLRELGTASFYDDRLLRAVGAPFSREAFARIAAADWRFLRAAAGRGRKCLVLDCDNTLWGGIVGEAGVDGIALGPTFPGSAFVALQNEAKNLAARGVILALCSRNNPEDVWEVFRRHPAMLLQEKDIAAAAIGWEDKVSGLGRLAAELNIGLDTMVLVDDSPFEIDMVRATLPEVATLCLEAGREASFPGLLASCGLFDSLAVSAEDRQRGAMYRAEAQRRQVRQEATSLTSYLAGLMLVVGVRRGTAADLPRLAQLCQRTNQFNLTGRRYTEEQLAACRNDPASDILTITVEDRFGGYGSAGLVILRQGEGETTIDTLLLSCRVLGRGVETVLAAAALACAGKRHSKRLIGIRLPTAKNAPTGGFYPAAGFTPLPCPAGLPDGCQCFGLDTGARLETPSHIQTVWELD